MTVVRRADQRTHETPNAVMTTLASPTLGGAAQSLWQVRMRPGQAGPDHVMDVEQVWTVVDGGMALRTADGETVLTAGDTAVLPAGVARRIVADPEHGLTAPLPDGTDRGVPDWVR